MLKAGKMYSFLVALFFLLLISSVFGDYFSDTVHTVHVYFDNPSYWTELYATHTTEEYMMCKVVFDAVDTLDSVGIRLKGNSSFNHPGNKKPFHLKLDEYIDNQNYDGNERLSFNNCYNDPTFLREKLSCDIFQGMGVPCPRACWSVVYFNDTYWGFYSTTDPINKQALNRFYSWNKGNLYDCEQSAYLTWLGWSQGLYTSSYLISANEDADDYTDLINFIDFLNNTDNATFVAQILDWFDPIEFARMWAVNTFLVNLDSYQGFGRNYFFYFDHNTVGHYIVYDLNMSFGGFNQYGFTPTQLRELEIDWYNTSGGGGGGGGGFPPTPAGRPLAERCFNVWEPFWGLVNCAIRELMETTLDTVTFNARVTELADLVRPYVYDDVNKQFSNAAFETNLDYDYSSGGGGGGGGGMGTIPGLRDLIMDRYAYIAGVVGGCERLDVSGVVLINELMASNGTTIADEADQFDDWFEVYNPADTTIDISYWFATDNLSNPRKWSFPSGTVIPAGGYLVVWADDDPEQGPLHATFKLNKDEEELAIFGSDFIGAQLSDSVSWMGLERDESWGRYPNGSATWQICLEATPGAENSWSAIYSNGLSVPTGLTLLTYPNPFNSSCRIEIEGAEMRIESIEIFDISGRQIDHLNLNNSAVMNTCKDSPGNNRRQIVWKPNEKTSSGVFYVRVVSENSEVVKKIIYLK
jgi:hypothetical protein